MITRPGPVVAAFETAGWTWGGDATSADYHHFSKQREQDPAHAAKMR